MLIVCVRGGWGLAAGLGAGVEAPLAAAVVGFGGSALDVAGADFAFDRWLVQALQLGWLQAVEIQVPATTQPGST